MSLVSSCGSFLSPDQIHSILRTASMNGHHTVEVIASEPPPSPWAGQRRSRKGPTAVKSHLLVGCPLTRPGNGPRSPWSCSTRESPRPARGPRANAKQQSPPTCAPSNAPTVQPSNLCQRPSSAEYSPPPAE